MFASFVLHFDEIMEALPKNSPTIQHAMLTMEAYRVSSNTMKKWQELIRKEYDEPNLAGDSFVDQYSVLLHHTNNITNELISLKQSQKMVMNEVSSLNDMFRIELSRIHDSILQLQSQNVGSLVHENSGSSVASSDIATSSSERPNAFDRLCCKKERAVHLCGTTVAKLLELNYRYPGRLVFTDNKGADASKAKNVIAEAMKHALPSEIAVFSIPCPATDDSNRVKHLQDVVDCSVMIQAHFKQFLEQEEFKLRDGTCEKKRKLPERSRTIYNVDSRLRKIRKGGGK